jgi:SAM-dependent methyltransferase
MSDVSAEYWGAKYFDASFHRAEWQAHPASLARLSRIQKDLMRDDWFAKTYLGGVPAKRAMGVGVGTAQTELSLVRKGYIEHIDLYDISSVGLDHAKAVAESEGFGHRVTCHCADFDNVAVPTDRYDLVTFCASLHHMADLDDTLSKVRNSLKPGGMLWGANEYVGPDRFGFPDEHLKLARSFFRNLPEKFRRHRLPELPLPTVEEVAAVDPTEAPCSSQIVDAVKSHFPGAEIVELYGSFAFMVFWGLNYDALYESEEGANLVRVILAVDRGLVENGELPGYFAHIVAKKDGLQVSPRSVQTSFFRRLVGR